MSQMQMPIVSIITGVDKELSSYNFPMYIPGSVFASITPNQNIYKSVTLEPGEVVEHVAFFNQILAGSPKTLKLLYSNTSNVRSSAGKTAKVILILQARTVNPLVNIRSSTGIDTSNGTVIQVVSNSDWAVNDYLTVEVALPLQSNGYLTIDPLSGANVDIEGGAIIRAA